MYDDILKHCNYLLHNLDNPALEYLNSRATEKYFEFGYYPKNLNLLKDYFSEQYLKELNLLKSIS